MKEKTPIVEDYNCPTCGNQNFIFSIEKTNPSNLNIREQENSVPILTEILRAKCASCNVEITRTERFCILIGGHFWDDVTNRNIMYPTNPPQYPPEQRMCAHCERLETKEVTHKEEWVSSDL